MRTARLLMAAAALATMISLAPARAMADDAPVPAGAAAAQRVGGDVSTAAADDTCYYT